MSNLFHKFKKSDFFKNRISKFKKASFARASMVKESRIPKIGLMKRNFILVLIGVHFLIKL